MKFLTAVALLFITSSSFAAAGETGLGVMIGNPIGLNGKHWLDDSHAVDGGIALSLGGSSNVSLHSDYLFHSEGAFFYNDVNPLDLYYGIGGRMKFADDVEIGLRAPVGLAHKFTEKNSDMFAEIAPILDFVGRIGLDFHLAVGARYYF